MQRLIEGVRSLVRPVVTIGVVGAFIIGAFIDTDASDILKDITLVVIGFWFAERAAERGGGGV